MGEYFPDEWSRAVTLRMDAQDVTIATLTAERDRLAAELAEARAALRPFAQAAKHYAYSDGEDRVMSRRAYICGPHFPAPTVIVNDLRRAARSMEADDADR